MERKPVGFVEAFKLFWLNYVNFKGRSRRSEFWWAMLWQAIINSLLVFFGFILLVASPIFGLLVMLVYVLFAIACLIPNLALSVRRFHDRGLSMLVPIISFIVGIIFGIVNIFTERTTQFEAGNSTVTSFDGFIPWQYGLILFVICLGFQIFQFVIYLLDSKQETNKYGPSPKYIHGDHGHGMVNPTHHFEHQKTIEDAQSVQASNEHQPLKDFNDVEQQDHKAFKKDDTHS
ncbi:DUF805 domain-containing protein [Staphylococcus ratti]